MRGAMLYVNAGKGHYVPAIALADSFNKAGHKAIVEDLFIAMGTPFWEWFCKYDWRFLLHHPHLEGICHYMTDNRLSTQLIKGQGLTKGHLSSLEAWYRKYKPDFRDNPPFRIQEAWNRHPRIPVCCGRLRHPAFRCEQEHHEDVSSDRTRSP